MKIRSTRRNGFAAIFILVLLAIMTTYLVSNAVFLRSLKRQIQEIDQQQVQRHRQSTLNVEHEDRGTIEKSQGGAH